MSTKMYDLYDCKPILRMPSNVKIRKCIRSEDHNGITLVMYCDNYHILYYYLNKCQTNCDNIRNKPKNNVIIRQIPIDKSKGELRSMSLSPNNSLLVIIVANSTIFLIPIQKLISRQNDYVLRDDSVVIESCSLRSPTAVVFWSSLDELTQMAIVGNDFGEISFIDIKSKREIGGTYVHNSVKALDIIDDRSAVSLLIDCKNETQFRLILEETRSKSISKTKVETQGSTQEHKYFNCFINTPEERETIGPNNCWNFKPILIDMFRDNNMNETNEIIATTLVYQKPQILCISEAMSESEEFGQIIVRLFSNKEFDYSLAAFSAKYLIPKQSSHSINSIILTDRLFVVCSVNNCSVVSREFADSRKLAKLNPIIQTFLFESEEVINSFMFFRSNTNDGRSDDFLNSFIIITCDCLYVCHQKQSCQQIFESMVALKPLVLSDSSLLAKAHGFAAMLGLNVSALYDKTALSCLEKRQFASAVRFYQLAKTAQIKRIASFVSLGYLSETIAYIEVLFASKCYEMEDCDRMHFANIAINCFVQQLLQKRVRSDANDLEKRLKVFLKECLYYDESVVLRLLVEQGLFDLAQYCAERRAQTGLLLSYLFKSSYLRSEALKADTYERVIRTEYKDLLINTTECLPQLNCFTSSQITYSLILHKELIAKYLRFLVQLLPNLEMTFLLRLAVIFDPRRSATQLLLNRVLTHLKETYLNSEDIDQQIIERKDVLNVFIFIILMILRQNCSVSAFEEKFISIDPFIKEIENSSKKRLLIEPIGLNAGLSHSAYIRNGCLYMWGKSQFGCCGLQSQDFTNIPKLIPNPMRLDLFKEVLSISVKSVSCGAHHSLILTDFGVYAFGSSRFGQLGLGRNVILSRNPIIISELVNKDIVRIECGQYHSLAISCDGRLWTWGWNLHGQLGLGHIEDQYTPTIVQYLSAKVIVQAFAGFGHTIALDSNGFVYSFGNGTYGQLGLGVGIKHNIPQNVILLNEPIVQIATKYFHSLALSRDNQTLYIWGSNPQLFRLKAHYVRKARLNQQTNRLFPNVVPNQDYLMPTRVDISNINTRIIKLCAGSLHSLLLTDEGELYSFGRGTDGQLGLGKVKDIKIPTKIVALNEIKVRDIAAGSDYSLVVDINDNIWGFGNNSDSQIGPKRSVGPKNSNYCSIDDKNKKISIKTNRRIITLVTGGKCLEQLPIRIDVLEGNDNYCDSLNYSLDINAMKCSTSFAVMDDNINVLTDENSVTFDRQVLAVLLAFYRKELDLNSVVNRCQHFKCYQMTAFVYELQNDFPNAFDFQLRALKMSLPKDSHNFSIFYTKIFSIFVAKAVESIDKMTKILDLFLQFWIECEFTFDLLEMLLYDSYKNEIQDSMFGISFFNYLKHKPNIINKFESSFLLEMVDFTIRTIAKRPEKLYSYQTDIERITADVEDVSFPAEKLWQNILTYFQSNKNSNSSHEIGVEIDPIDEEIIFFNCKHFYGFNDFRQTVVSDFEEDIQQLEGMAKNDIQSMLDFYRDSSKELWDSVCPKCFIKLNQKVL